MTPPATPQPGATRRWAKLAPLLPVAAAVAVVLLFFWKLAFTNLILARGDTFLYFYPYWDYRARALLAGRLPLWDPLLFMGAPFLANSQAGVLYPLNWPLALFAAPQAVKIAIIAHLAIAALGAFAFARRALSQSALSSLMAAGLFSLGGYLTSQIEHVNQLQGLAWLPWLLLAAHVLVTRLAAGPPSLRRATPPALAFAVLVALQILAGHTQTAFISLAGAFLYALVLSLIVPRFVARELSARASDSKGTPFPDLATIQPSGIEDRREAGREVRSDISPAPPRHRFPLLLTTLLVLTASALLAVLLSAAQVLPTLELSSQSLRGGGLSLREALSFSLDPRLLGRALLPGYSRGLFSEFVVYVGLVGLALAVAGLRRRPERLALMVVAAAGLVFALGAYDPLYVLLAAVPPFNLFRVPARWLALFALAVAFLAGSGLDEFAHASRRRKAAMLLAPLGPVALTPLAARLVAAGETGPLGLPQAIDFAGWLLPLALLGLLLWLPARPAWRAPLAGALALVELFVASWALPYNQLTAPEAYTSVRPAMTQLLAALQPPPAGIAGTLDGGNLVASSSLVTTVTASDSAPIDLRLSPGVPGRFLSMSALRFDPGDLAELQGELGPQLPSGSVYDYVIATKNKEVLSPNLPLAWGIPAVDGYDGGVLPLRHYADFARLFTDAASADGRLRENLTSAPDPRLLRLMNVRYLITDKVDDAWVKGVFYDLQFTLTLPAGQSAQIAYVPPFRATAIGVVADSYSGEVFFTTADGNNYRLPITNYQSPLPQPIEPETITLTGPLTIRGISLIDTRTGAFQSLTLGPYRLVHSGDVKVYENLAVLARAFVAPIVGTMLNDDQARGTLGNPGWPIDLSVIQADQPPMASPVGALRASRPATITTYLPERVVLTANGPGILVVADAYYPGWTATIDGAPAPIHRADIMFRAVSLPAGQHQVEFRYSPSSVWVGLAISALAWLGLAASIIVLRRRR